MAGVTLSAVSLAAFLGSQSWILDGVANFRPQAAVVLLVLGLVALAGPWRLAAWITLGSAVVGGLLVVPFFVGSDTPVADGSPTLEVMTFNVGVSNPNRAEVAAFIAAEDPDVAFIIESSFEWEDAVRASGTGLTLVTVVPSGRVAGISVLARPSLSPLALDPGIGPQAAAVSVDLGDGRIEILGLHPPSPMSAARAASRDRLMALAGEWVASRSDEVVVVGDFNATPWSHAYRTLRGTGGLADTLRGSGLQPSWPAGWGPLMVTIDHVLHTAGLGSRDRRTGPAFESAHRPVMVTIGRAG